MFRMITMIGIAATLVAIAGHYTLFGPKRIEGKGGRTVKRFGFLEIILHALTLLTFLTLSATGLMAVFNNEALRGKMWVLHVAVGPVFVLALSVLILSWARDCRFESHDWDWAKKFGGYLWGDKHAPAGRFNAGQKGYFWAVAALALVTLVTGLGRVAPMLGETGQDLLYWGHRLGALCFVLAALAHLYLGTLANPGTFGAILTGKVTSQWARDHHPQWSIEGSGACAQKGQPADLTGKKSFEQK